MGQREEWTSPKLYGNFVILPVEREIVLFVYMECHEGSMYGGMM
jgi:hypothetical protein